MLYEKCALFITNSRFPSLSQKSTLTEIPTFSADKIFLNLLIINNHQLTQLLVKWYQNVLSRFS